MISTVQARVTHRFESSAERIYDAWLNPEKAQHWLKAASIQLGLAGEMRRVEIDARVGGSFFFSDMRDGTETKHWGTYIELNRPHKIVFTWITDEKKEDDPSKVTLAIEPDGEGCMASIVHELEAKWAEYIPQTEKGWSSFLNAIDASVDASK